MPGTMMPMRPVSRGPQILGIYVVVFAAAAGPREGGGSDGMIVVRKAEKIYWLKGSSLVRGWGVAWVHPHRGGIWRR